MANNLARRGGANQDFRIYIRARARKHRLNSYYFCKGERLQRSSTDKCHSADSSSGVSIWQITGLIIFGPIVMAALIALFALIDFVIFRISVKLFKREETLSKLT
jgi:hypothetical protein